MERISSMSEENITKHHVDVQVTDIANLANDHWLPWITVAFIVGGIIFTVIFVSRRDSLQTYTRKFCECLCNKKQTRLQAPVEVAGMEIAFQYEPFEQPMNSTASTVAIGQYNTFIGQPRYQQSFPPSYIEIQNFHGAKNLTTSLR